MIEGVSRRRTFIYAFFYAFFFFFLVWFGPLSYHSGYGVNGVYDDWLARNLYINDHFYHYFF